MTETRECRQCLLPDMLDEYSLHKLIRQRIALLPNDEKTGQAEYRRRLALCKQCNQLNHGTCMQCGCYVEIRAAKHALHCAHSNQKW